MNKKSLNLVVGLVLLVSTASFAQFGKGDKIWNLGVGLNSPYNGGIPLHTSFEVGVSDVLSVGGHIDFLSYKYRVNGVDYGYNAFYTGARVSYHFNKLFKLSIDELDIYGGGSLGYRSFSWKNDVTGNTSGRYGSSIYADVHAGARWYFKPSFGVFLEVGGGGGSSNARGGVAFRF